jgi:hypothetical protein
MAEGWIRAYRSRFENPLFEGEKYCKGYAWDWLVSNAAWKEKRVDVNGKIITLQRGQLSYSERFLAKAWGWSQGSVHRFLLRLQNEKMIRIETESGQIVITICNYCKYQDIEDESESGANRERIGSESGANQIIRREEGKKVRIDRKESTDRGGVGEKPKPEKLATRLPENWQPSPQDFLFAQKEGLTENETNRELAIFRDYWHAASGAKATKLDWSAIWRNWIRRKADDKARRQTAPRQGAGAGQGNTGRSLGEIIATGQAAIEKHRMDEENDNRILKDLGFTN